MEKRVEALGKVVLELQNDSKEHKNGLSGLGNNKTVADFLEFYKKLDKAMLNERMDLLRRAKVLLTYLPPLLGTQGFHFHTSPTSRPYKIGMSIWEIDSSIMNYLRKQACQRFSHISACSLTLTKESTCVHS